MDVICGSLRVRCTSTTTHPVNFINNKELSEQPSDTDNEHNFTTYYTTYEHKRINNSDLWLCPSVMSPETKRLLPPTTETIQTKPFPIRGKLYYIYINSYS